MLRVELPPERRGEAPTAAHQEGGSIIDTIMSLICVICNDDKGQDNKSVGKVQYSVSNTSEVRLNSSWIAVHLNLIQYNCFFYQFLNSELYIFNGNIVSKY